MSSLSSFGFKPVASTTADASSTVGAASKRGRAAPAKKAATAAASSSTANAGAGAQKMVQATLCFGAARPAATAATTNSSSSSSNAAIDLSDENEAGGALEAPAAAASGSAAAAALRRSPRKGTAEASENSSTTGAATAAVPVLSRSVLSFVKPRAASAVPTPAATATTATASTQKRGKRSRVKEESSASESEAQEEEKAPAATSKRRKHTATTATAAAEDDSAATAATSKRRRAAPTAAAAVAAASSTAAAASSSSSSALIPEEFLRRSSRAAAVTGGRKGRKSYKEKEENEEISGAEEEKAEEAEDDTAAAAAMERSPRKPSAAAARRYESGITAPFFSNPPPAYLAAGSSSAVAAASSSSSCVAGHPLADRCYNILLSLRARSSSYASRTRWDGGHLPVTFARMQPATNRSVRRQYATADTIRGILGTQGSATSATMENTTAASPSSAVASSSSSSAAVASSLVAASTSSSSSAAVAPLRRRVAPSLHASSFGSSFDQCGLSGLPRALVRRSSILGGDGVLPVVVRSRFDVGAGGGLTASQFKGYTLSYSGDGRMLVLGGHGGVVKLFHRSPGGLEDPRQEQEQVCEDQDQVVSPFEADYMQPCTTIVAHHRWVSAAKFMPSSHRDTSKPFLTTSDDSTLKLWSTEQLVAEEREVAGGPSSWVHAPRSLCTVRPHSSGMGIYDFDVSSEGGLVRVATGGKDGHIVLSQVTAADIRTKTRTLEGFHSGVIKSVAFRDSNTLASCGNDKHVSVLDLRSPGAEARVLRLEGLHTLSAHTVRWNPSNPFQLLSAALDCRIQLSDIRMTGSNGSGSSGEGGSSVGGPLFTLASHFPRSITRSPSAFKPVFAWQGMTVLTASTSNSLFLYSSTTGELLRTLPMGFSSQQIASLDDPSLGGGPGFATYSKRLLHHMDFKMRA